MGPIYYRPTLTRAARGERKAFSNYHECASVWVRQSQDEGHTPNDRMYFRGRTIYSYRSNWPLAHIFYAPGNVAHVLVNTSRVSNTTSRHLSEVHGAINRYFGSEHTVFEVDVDTLNAWRDNDASARQRVYDYMSAQLAEAIGKASRARSEWKKSMEHGRAERLVRQGNALAHAFGDPAPFPTNHVEAFAAAISDALEAA